MTTSPTATPSLSFNGQPDVELAQVEIFTSFRSTESQRNLPGASAFAVPLGDNESTLPAQHSTTLPTAQATLVPSSAASPRHVRKLPTERERCFSIFMGVSVTILLLVYLGNTIASSGGNNEDGSSGTFAPVSFDVDYDGDYNGWSGLYTPIPLPIEDIPSEAPTAHNNGTQIVP